ncbi:hypothetical protein ACHAXT_003741 [Thalassiosira profunda]
MVCSTRAAALLGLACAAVAQNATTTGPTVGESAVAEVLSAGPTTASTPAPLPAEGPTSAPVALADIDFNAYGYPHVHIAAGSTGWVTWHVDAASDSSTHDEFTSAQECAAQCQVENATSGAWSGKYQYCWCYFLDVADLCREPCVEEDYVDFGPAPIEEMGYCEKSVCDPEWFYSEEYCDVNVGFDAEACNVKLWELGLGATDGGDGAPADATGMQSTTTGATVAAGGAATTPSPGSGGEGEGMVRGNGANASRSVRGWNVLGRAIVCGAILSVL